MDNNGTFNETSMLHFVRSCLFQPESPLHQEFSNSLHQLITTCITNRKTEWFPSMSRDDEQVTGAEDRWTLWMKAPSER